MDIKQAKKRAYITLVLIGITTALSIFAIFKNFGLDYNFENFFPNDEDTEFYMEFREKFETDNDFMMIGLKNNSGIFNKEFLTKVDQLTKDIEELNYIDSVTSPTNIQNVAIYGKDLIEQRPFLNWQIDSLYERDSIDIYKDDRLIGSYFAANGKSVAILVKTEQYLKKEGCDYLTKNVTEILDKYDFDAKHVSGRALAQTYYINLMSSDLKIFMTASGFLLVIFLYIAFRSSWGIVIPMTVVMLSLIWVLGLLAATGGKINLILTVLPTIMFCVGISDVVHIIAKYLEELRLGKPKLEALRVVYKEVGLATFLTSLTTAIGFLTLLTVSVGPVRVFGVYSAAGVVIAYILAFTFLPAIFVLMNEPKTAKKETGVKNWNKLMNKSFLFAIRNPKKILLVSFFIVVGCVFAITKMEINNYLLEDLKSENPIKKDFDFFEGEFGGMRPFELAVTLKDTTKNIFDKDVLEDIDTLNNYLLNEYKVGNLVTPLTLIKSVNMMQNGGMIDYYEVPRNKLKYKIIRKKIGQFIENDSSQVLVSKNLSTGRIMGKVGDWGSVDFIRKDKELNSFIANNLDTTVADYKITGTATLIDKNNQALSYSMLRGLILAFFIIAIIMGIVYKSVKIVLLALIPNILPLLIIAAIMYIYGIDLKVSTSIIFTMAFGIAVDDTIHFMSKLRIELSKKKSYLFALRRTMLSTGKAIIITTFILTAGFLTLLYSDFLGTYLIGLLIGITLLMAVVADLILLPAILVLFYKPKSKK